LGIGEPKPTTSSDKDTDAGTDKSSNPEHRFSGPFKKEYDLEAAFTGKKRNTAKEPEKVIASTGKSGFGSIFSKILGLLKFTPVGMMLTLRKKIADMMPGGEMFKAIKDKIFGGGGLWGKMRKMMRFTPGIGLLFKFLGFGKDPKNPEDVAEQASDSAEGSSGGLFGLFRTKKSVDDIGSSIRPPSQSGEEKPVQQSDVNNANKAKAELETIANNPSISPELRAKAQAIISQLIPGSIIYRNRKKLLAMIKLALGIRSKLLAKFGPKAMFDGIKHIGKIGFDRWKGGFDRATAIAGVGLDGIGAMGKTAAKTLMKSSPLAMALSKFIGTDTKARKNQMFEKNGKLKLERSGVFSTDVVNFLETQTVILNDIRGAVLEIRDALKGGLPAPAPTPAPRPMRQQQNLLQMSDRLDRIASGV
jgi:hypothetical protein